jgi:hypothetical protein
MKFICIRRCCPITILKTSRDSPVGSDSEVVKRLEPARSEARGQRVASTRQPVACRQLRNDIARQQESNAEQTFGRSVDCMEHGTVAVATQHDHVLLAAAAVRVSLLVVHTTCASSEPLPSPEVPPTAARSDGSSSSSRPSTKAVSVTSVGDDSSSSPPMAGSCPVAE